MPEAGGKKSAGKGSFDHGNRARGHLLNAPLPVRFNAGVNRGGFSEKQAQDIILPCQCRALTVQRQQAKLKHLFPVARRRE